eukprot:201270-Pelagomonas_calceolata.AAC.2
MHIRAAQVTGSASAQSGTGERGLEGPPGAFGLAEEVEGVACSSCEWSARVVAKHAISRVRAKDAEGISDGCEGIDVFPNRRLVRLKAPRVAELDVVPPLRLFLAANRKVLFLCLLSTYVLGQQEDQDKRLGQACCQ